MSELVSVRGLHKSYGKNNEVLKGLDFDFQPNQTIGLLGPNGCGKTTLIKILTGLINDYEGEVKIDGHSPDEYTKSIVAYLPERTYLADWMRPIDAINYFADFYKDFDREKALEMLHSFQLPEKQKIKSMSKGMKEKVQLMLVMSRSAKIYILDEPLGGVDPAARDFILDTIMTNIPQGSTMMLSTHLISDVERIFNRVLMISSGHVVVDSDVEAIRNDGKTIEELFKEVFRHAF